MFFDDNPSVDSDESDDDELSIDSVDPLIDNRGDSVDGEEDEEEEDGDEQLEEQPIAPTGEYSINVLQYFLFFILIINILLLFRKHQCKHFEKIDCEEDQMSRMLANTSETTSRVFVDIRPCICLNRCSTAAAAITSHTTVASPIFAIM